MILRDFLRFSRDFHDSDKFQSDQRKFHHVKTDRSKVDKIHNRKVDKFYRFKSCKFSIEVSTINQGQTIIRICDNFYRNSKSVSQKNKSLGSPPNFF